MKKIVSFILIFAMLFSFSASVYAENTTNHSISPTNIKSALDKEIFNLSGYAYDPNSDNDFKLIGDIILDIDFSTNTGRLVSDRDIFEFDFKLDNEENDRVDYSGKVKNGDTTLDLLLSVINDNEIKVYGLIDGKFAFNAGNTIKYSELREQAKLSLEKAHNDISIFASSSDPYVVANGTKNSIYAQLLKPGTHPYGQVKTYGIRINTVYSGVDSLRTVRKFKATGTVTNAELINTNPSGDGVLPTPWYVELLYYYLSYVGMYVNSSAGYAYKGSIINNNYQMEIAANEKWVNFIYTNDSGTNGCGFRLHINNDKNKLPDITVNTSLDIYETMTGYVTISGPTLSY